MKLYEYLNNPSNYISGVVEEDNEIVTVFLKLLNTYHILFKNNISCKNKTYCNFIYKEGIKCICNVFILFITYTNNLNFTYYHCEKSIYYYTEFISQIKNDNCFFKMSSTDAIIFVYKKTIYKLDRTILGNHERPCGDKMDNIVKIIQIIINVNSLDSYDTLYPYYIDILSQSNTLDETSNKLNKCVTLNELHNVFKSLKV